MRRFAVSFVFMLANGPLAAQTDDIAAARAVFEGNHQRDPRTESPEVPVVLPAVRAAGARRDRRDSRRATTILPSGRPGRTRSRRTTSALRAAAGLVYGTYRYRCGTARTSTSGSPSAFREDADWLEDRCDWCDRHAAGNSGASARDHRRDVDRRPGRSGDRECERGFARRQDRLRWNGVAVSVPAGIDVTDARGMWITPGSVDAHVHFSQTGWADGRPMRSIFARRIRTRRPGRSQSESPAIRPLLSLLRRDVGVRRPAVTLVARTARSIRERQRAFRMSSLRPLLRPRITG